MDPVTIGVIAAVLTCGSAFLSVVIKTIQLKRLIEQDSKKR